jgi:hypothetical protein
MNIAELKQLIPLPVGPSKTAEEVAHEQAVKFLTRRVIPAIRKHSARGDLQTQWVSAFRTIWWPVYVSDLAIAMAVEALKGSGYQVTQCGTSSGSPMIAVSWPRHQSIRRIEIRTVEDN